MEKEKKPTALNNVKADYKKIERFCKSRPTPIKKDLEVFIEENGLQAYKAYAEALLVAATEKEWILF